MKTEAQRAILVVVFWGVVAFLASNSLTLPGYGLSGGKIVQIERHFGWPAEYYADLWVNESSTEPYIGRFVFLVPLFGGMRIKSWAFSIVALGLNFAVVTGIAVLLVFLVLRLNQVKLGSWATAITAVAIVVLFAAFRFADGLSVYL